MIFMINYFVLYIRFADMFIYFEFVLLYVRNRAANTMGAVHKFADPEWTAIAPGQPNPVFK